jgi:DNA modification methylase
MTDARPLERCAIITGYGNASPKQEPPSQASQRPSYQWRISARRAADIAAELYPYLLVKRKQAMVLWNHQSVRESYTVKRGVTIPKAALEKQQYCWDLSHRLNKGEDVDLPSWMVEPPRMETPGWYLRSDCIWAKPNPMPESVTDRPTRSHEYLFLLTKSARYYYDAKAIAEPVADGTVARLSQPTLDTQTGSSRANGGAKTNGNMKAVPASWHGSSFTDERDLALRPTTSRKQRWPGIGPQHAAERDRNETYEPMETRDRRNKRDVWTISTKPFKGAHFATMPPDLVEPCILAGSKPGDVILDPFAGAGTVPMVAERLGRRGIGIELSMDYCQMADERIYQDAPLWAEGVHA